MRSAKTGLGDSIRQVLQSSVVSVVCLLSSAVSAMADGEKASSTEMTETYAALFQEAQMVLNTGDVEAAIALAQKGEAEAIEEELFGTAANFRTLYTRIRYAVENQDPEFINVAHDMLNFCLDLKAQHDLDMPCEANARYAMGVIMSAQSDPAGAMTQFGKAANLAEAEGDKLAMGRVEFGISTVLNSIGEHEAAIPHMERALEFSEDMGRLSAAVMYNAAITYNGADRHRDAVDRALKGLELGDGRGGPAPEFLVPQIYELLADSELSLGNVNSAQSYIDLARSKIAETGLPGLGSKLDYFQARLDYEYGDRAKALSDIQAIADSMANGPDAAGYMDVLDELGTLYARAEQYELAYKAEREWKRAAASQSQRLSDLVLGIQADNDNIHAATLAHGRELAQVEADKAAAQTRLARTQRWVMIAASSVLLSFLALMWLTARRRQAINSELRTALKQRDLLFAEINHRVKNNLQLISSIVSMQRRRSRRDPVETTSSSQDRAMQSVQMRVQTMALIHQHLYSTDEVNQLEMAGLIENLSQLVASLDPQAVDISYDLDHLVMSLDGAMPIGLMVCELVSNSIEHARRDKGALQIKVSFNAKGETWALRVEDNGDGFTDDIRIETAKSLGLTLIHDLSAQLKGDVGFCSSALGGACITVTGPLKGYVDETPTLTHKQTEAA